MKSKLFRGSVLALVAFVLINVSSAQTAPAGTNVGGPIISDTTWTVSGSPYFVIANVQVLTGIKLTIQPGVEVKFNAGKLLQVDGTLIARGTSTAPITFTSNLPNPQPGDWGNIEFTDTSVDATFDGGGNYVSGSILQYCTVEYGGSGSTVRGAIETNTASPLIDHCIVRNNSNAGIYGGGTVSVPIIISNNIVNGNSASNGGGINASDAWVTGNTVSGNSTSYGNAGGILAVSSTVMSNTVTSNMANEYGKGGGIYAESSMVTDNTITGNRTQWGNGGGIAAANSTVVRNTVTGNLTGSEGGGIYARFSTVMSNTVTMNETSYLGGGIYAESCTVMNNAIISNWTYDSGGGIYVWGGTVRGNTIVANKAWSSGQGSGAYFLSAGDVSYNTVVGNTSIMSTTAKIGGVTAAYSGGSQFHYNNFYGNSPYDVVIETSYDLSGTNNYWGTVATVDILAHVYDWYDDTSRGRLLYIPYLQDPDPNAPVPPPLNLRATFSDDSVTLSWDPIPSFGTGYGYKVYYGTDKSGPPYTGSGLDQGNSPIDVGNVTSYTLTGLGNSTVSSVSQSIRRVQYMAPYTTIGSHFSIALSPSSAQLTKSHVSSFSPWIDIVQPGDLITYTLTYSNSAQGTPLANGIITDTLPVSVTYVNSNGLPAPDLSLLPSQRIIRWFVGSVPTNTMGSVGYVVSVNNPDQVPDGGVISNTAQLGATGLNPIPSNTDIVPIRYRFDLGMNMTDGRIKAHPGSILTYTFYITNVAVLPITVTDVAVTDYLEPGLPGLTQTHVLNCVAPCAGWNFAGVDLYGDQVYSRTIPQLGPNQSISLAMVTQVSPTLFSDAPDVFAVANYADVIASDLHGIEINGMNQSQEDIDVVAGPDIAVTELRADNSRPMPNVPTNFYVTLANIGFDPTIGPDGTGWFGVDLYIKPAYSPPPVGPADRYFGACPTATDYCPTTFRFDQYSIAKFFTTTLGAGGLSADESWPLTYTLAITPAGTYWIYGQADTYWGEPMTTTYGTEAHGRIVEGNEVNNIFGPIPIIVGSTSSGTYYFAVTAYDTHGHESWYSNEVAAIRANLAVTKTDSPDPVYVGQPLTYTIIVTNNGPSLATGVKVTDTLPVGVVFSSVTSPCIPAGSIITCDLGSLANGNAATIKIVVTPWTPGMITNTVSVTSSEIDLDTTNNMAMQATTVKSAADLQVFTLGAPNPAKLDSTLVYTLYIWNAGPSTATGVRLTDTLPANVTFRSATSSQGSCNGTSTITCTLGSLTSNLATTVGIDVMPTKLGPITNTVSVTGNEADLFPLNNTDTHNTSVKAYVYLPIIRK